MLKWLRALDFKDPGHIATIWLYHPMWISSEFSEEYREEQGKGLRACKLKIPAFKESYSSSLPVRGYGPTEMVVAAEFRAAAEQYEAEYEEGCFREFWDCVESTAQNEMLGVW